MSFFETPEEKQKRKAVKHAKKFLKEVEKRKQVIHETAERAKKQVSDAVEQAQKEAREALYPYYEQEIQWYHDNMGFKKITPEEYTEVDYRKHPLSKYCDYYGSPISRKHLRAYLDSADPYTVAGEDVLLLVCVTSKTFNNPDYDDLFDFLYFPRADLPQVFEKSSDPLDFFRGFVDDEETGNKMLDCVIIDRDNFDNSVIRGLDEALWESRESGENKLANLASDIELLNRSISHIVDPRKFDWFSRIAQYVDPEYLIGTRWEDPSTWDINNGTPVDYYIGKECHAERVAYAIEHNLPTPPTPLNALEQLDILRRGIKKTAYETYLSSIEKEK